MAKKMVIDYKGIDIDALIAKAREINKQIEENQFDSIEDYLGVVKYKELLETLKANKFLTVREFRKIFGVAFSEDMSGKLETIIALSTSSLLNPRCLARMQDGNSICAFCFAGATQNRYPDLRENLERNYIIMNSVVIPAKYWPQVGNDMMRFEAFGDGATWKHDANCFECARANKGTACALWSKNPDVTAEAIAKGYKKPKNVIYIYSSPKVNTPAEIEELLKKYPFIDKIFTVFDAEFIKANNIDINCGARSCRGCKRCYKRATGKYVNEKIK